MIFLLLIYIILTLFFDNSLIKNKKDYFEKVISVKRVNYSLIKSNCNYGSNGPRIYCAVITHYNNLATKAITVNKTWGRRCEKLIFVTGFYNKKFNRKIPKNLNNVVHLNTTDIYQNLTAKSISMLKYIYETTTPYQFDWFLKADDDTYVIVENLKWFLKDKCRNETKTYGYNFFINGNYYQSGGAAYAISSEILQKLGSALVNDSQFCEIKSGIEDIEVANCLKKLNVTLGDSRDNQGRERFHCISFKDNWYGTARWIENYAMFTPKYGAGCCSPSSISFHYVNDKDKLKYDKLLYNRTFVEP